MLASMISMSKCVVTLTHRYRRMAYDAIRAQMDALMGAERDVPEEQKKNLTLHFYDDEVSLLRTPPVLCVCWVGFRLHIITIIRGLPIAGRQAVARGIFASRCTVEHEERHWTTAWKAGTSFIET